MKLPELFPVTFFLLLLFATGCQPDRSSSADLYSAVTRKSAVIIETGDLAQALQNIPHTKIYEEVDSLPPLLNFRQHLNALQSQFAEDSLLAYFHKRPLIIATALSGADKYNLLFVSSGDRDFEKSIGTKLGNTYQISKKTYSGAEVFHFYKENNQRNYYVSAYKDLLLFSTSQTLVEESIRQLNTEFNLKQNPDFQKLWKTSNKKDPANIYLNLEELPQLTKKLLPNTEPDFLNRMGSWAELDLQVHNQELIMSGLTLFPQTDAHYLQSFQKTTAQASKGQNIVPTSSGLWVALNFSNAEQYYRNYKNYLKRAGRLRMHEQLLEKLEFNAEEFLLHWVDTEIGLFASAGKSGANNHTAYLSYRNEKDVVQKLDQLADPDFIEGYRGMVIKKLTAENALPRLYGSLFKEFHYPYFIVNDGFVLFSENLPVLKGVINDILDEKTLGLDQDFQEFNANVPARSHLKVVASNPGFLPLLGHSLESGDARLMEQFSQNLNNFRWAALQLNVDGDAAYTNFYLLRAQKQEEKVSRQWSTQLESEVASEPQFLKNHVNKKYDIAIQDKDHRLYLLDYNGNILWTKMLDGPIMGDITQIDAYKNNKLQMLLNTPRKLYLIDRLGRDVEKFPVELPQAATAPAGVFNYDLARNYRLVVPVGNDLKNYDISGTEVKGWDFQKTETPIITKPQHFSVKGKDVIVVVTESGKLLQLNRRGEQRFEKIDGLPRLHIPFYLKEGEDLAKSEMLTIADNGKLYAVHPGGPADNLYLDEENPADHFLYFDEKYIFSSDDKLFVKSDEKPWSAEMEGDISARPKAMVFRNDFYAGAFSASAEEVRLYNKNGELIEGFPVFAQGPFDMGSLKVDGSVNVVTSSEDGTLICYRVE